MRLRWSACALLCALAEEFREAVEEDALSVSRLASLFGQLDGDGDGQASPLELLRAAEAARLGLATKDVEVALEEMDRNRDGWVTFEELHEGEVEPIDDDDRRDMEKRRTEDLQLFKAADVDADGRLTPAELRAVLYPETQQAPVPPPPPGPVAPVVPERFAAVEHLSVTELQQLQANVSAMDDLILEESKVKDLLQKLKAVRQEGRSVADAIMDREPKLQEAAVDYEGKREALAQLRSSVEAKIQQRQEILQKRSPQRLGVQLNARAQDAEQLAEETLNQALDAGSMDASGLSQFRQQFMQQKMKKHLNLALKSAVESCA